MLDEVFRQACALADTHRVLLEELTDQVVYSSAGQGGSKSRLTFSNMQYCISWLPHATSAVDWRALWPKLLPSPSPQLSQLTGKSGSGIGEYKVGC